MCGIAGKLNLDGQTPVDPALIQQMTDIMAHRGPDGSGTHVSGPVGLGHRRLSIIDLRAAGARPMCNEDRTCGSFSTGRFKIFGSSGRN